MTALSCFGSNVASATLSTACRLSTTTGGTTNTVSTTAPNDSTQFWVEVLSKGGTATDSSTQPAPTGNGWLLDSSILEGNTLQSGTWTITVTMNDSLGFTSIDINFRAFKRSSGGVFTTIGSLTLAAQTLSGTLTLFTITGSMPSMAFATGDKLYCDRFLHPVPADGHWTGDVIGDALSSSGTQGVTNNMQVVTQGFLPTATNNAPNYLGGGNYGQSAFNIWLPQKWSKLS